MRGVLLKTKWFYKYGMAILLFLCFGTFLMASSDIYSLSYTYCAEIFGASLFFCYREFYEAYLRGKCMWQKASILGVGAYCLLNIIFANNRSSFYYSFCQYIGFLISILAVIYYLWKERTII